MTRRVFFFLMALTLAAAGSSGAAWAQRPCAATLNNCPNQDVTFSKIQIGGVGSLSSNGAGFSNPGRLDDGTVAEADLEFTFDRTTSTLTLVAKNQTAGTASLTAIGFNVTTDVTGMSLVSHTGALPWELAFDSDRNDNVVDTHPSLQELRMDGFGRFSAFLGNKGIDTGGNGGDSGEILAGQSVTFVISVSGNIGNLTACSFTSQGSLIPPGDKIVTAVGRFQAGNQGGSGFIGPCGPGDLAVDLASFAVIPGDGVVRCDWATASEVDNAGFAIIRREVRTNSIERLNAQLIPAQGSPVSGAFYSFEDRTAVNGVKYLYRLEDFDLEGFNTLHPPDRAVPNPDHPPIRLSSPAYEAMAGTFVTMRWESDRKVPSRLEISADPSFPSEGTMTIPVGAGNSKRLSPRSMAEIRTMAASGEEGVYWRVTGRDPQGGLLRSQTFFLFVEP